MTSGRVYAKRALSPDEALRRMVQRAGAAYDTLVLRLFIRAAGVFPIGTAVIIDSGERGVVRRNGEDLLRPEVVVLAEDGEARPGSRQSPIRRTLDARAHGIDARKTLRAHNASRRTRIVH